MFENIAQEMIGGVVGNIILLIGFFAGTIYFNKNFVRKDKLEHYVTFESLNKTIDKYVKQDSLEKDLAQRDQLLNEKFEHIKKGIEQIQKSLDSKVA